MTTSLRSRLIRLAHTHPEHRAALLPLAKLASEAEPEGATMGKYEEGKPADPTENMSEEDKKEWELNTLKHKDKFKSAAQDDAQLRSRLIKLAHAHPEFRGDLLPLIRQAGTSKVGGRVVIRMPMSITLMVTQFERIAPSSPDGEMTGRISLNFGGADLDAVRFTATIHSWSDAHGSGYEVLSFTPLRSVSGAGADILTDVFKAALQEALDTKGEQLLGEIE